MNPIKKLKLKAQLRNCDYALAGTVIKQQYYDTTKNIEINRLIDQFMANPGFETALKLIEFNDMMVFYFTESCEGGLYVRKTMQQSDKITEAEAGEAAADQSDTVRDGGSEGPESEIASVASVPPASQSGSAPTSETKSSEKKEAVAKKSAKQDLLRKIDQRRNGAAANLEEDQAVSEVSATAEAASASAKPAQAKPQPAATDEVAEATQAAAKPNNAKQARSAAAVAPASRPTAARSSTAQQAADARPSGTAAQKSAAQQPDAQPAAARSSNADKPGAAKSVITKQRRLYPNVIATLQLDIHTMSKQLDEYKRELKRNPANDKQLKAWIKALEDAIREFHLAIDLLEDGR